MRLSTVPGNRQRRGHGGHVLLYYRDRAIPLYAGIGTSDSFEMYRIPKTNYVVVLSVNRRLGYAGVSVFDLADMKAKPPRFGMESALQPEWDFFVQGGQTEEALGRRWDEKSDMWITKVLLQWWQ